MKKPSEIIFRYLELVLLGKKSRWQLASASVINHHIVTIAFKF